MTTLSVDLYSCLESDLSDQGLHPRNRTPGPRLRHYAADLLLTNALKKWEPSDTKIQDEAALKLFLENNERCKRRYLPCIEFQWQDTLIGELRRILDDFWHRNGLPLVSTDLGVLARGRQGAGSAGGSRDTDFYTKMYDSPLWYTSPELLSGYQDYCSHRPYWRNSELSRLFLHGKDDRSVDGSKLTFVPKTDKISRSICVEPSLNMFYQLGLGSVISDRLKENFKIDLETQQFTNRWLASKGSRLDSLATYDLSSASDTISCNVLRFLLPKTFYRFLEKYRSPVTVHGQHVHELHMISSMGNGFTFPLETMIFAACVQAVYRINGIPTTFKGLPNDWGVYGDDIIITNDPVVCDQLEWLLSDLGFIVNKDKSFRSGPFRESCGLDSYLGKDVRSFYLKRLATPQDATVAINLINEYSAKVGIWFPKTVAFLRKRAVRDWVPRHENDDAGIRVPFSLFKGRMDSNNSYLYYAWVPRITRMRRYFPNQEGAMLAVLHGSLRHGCVVGRQKTTKYARVKRVTPSWDSSRPTHSEDWRRPWRQWDTAVYMNLFM